MIAAPIRQVAKAVDHVDETLPGDDRVTWNKTRTVARSENEEGSVEVRLKRVDAGNTEVTVQLAADTTGDPLMQLALEMMGPMYVDQLLDYVQIAASRDLDKGDIGL